MQKKELKTRFLTTYIGAMAVFFGAAVAVTLLFMLVLLLTEPAFSAVIHDIARYFVVNDYAIIYLLLWLGILLLLVLILGALSFRYFNRKVAEPLKTLTVATDQICGGEYDAEIIGADTEEIDELCRALDGMRLRLKEKAALPTAVCLLPIFPMICVLPLPPFAAICRPWRMGLPKRRSRSGIAMSISAPKRSFWNFSPPIWRSFPIWNRGGSVITLKMWNSADF